MLALVTGGLSKLGAVIAERLAAAGYDLALHVRDAGEPDAALTGSIDAHDVRCEMFAADLADNAAVEGLVARVAARFGRVPDCLVNSASMLSEGGWAEADLDALTDHFRVNGAAPVVLARRLAAALGPDGRGAVVNILDQRIHNPPVDQAAYTLSKLALAAATRVMARAFAPTLRVNAVAPGLTVAGEEFVPGQTGRLASLMPLGRLPGAREVADAVAYLARAEAVTGQILFVDGGAALESFRHDFAHMAR